MYGWPATNAWTRVFGPLRNIEINRYNIGRYLSFPLLAAGI